MPGPGHRGRLPGPRYCCRVPGLGVAGGPATRAQPVLHRPGAWAVRLRHRARPASRGRLPATPWARPWGWPGWLPAAAVPAGGAARYGRGRTSWPSQLPERHGCGPVPGCRHRGAGQLRWPRQPQLPARSHGPAAQLAVPASWVLPQYWLARPPGPGHRGRAAGHASTGVAARLGGARQLRLAPRCTACSRGCQAPVPGPAAGGYSAGWLAC